MRWVVVILFVMLFVRASAQQYAEKEYYLVDSLDLSELSKDDHELIDSCLTIFHKTEFDTTKATIVFEIIDNVDNKIAEIKYSRWLLNFTSAIDVNKLDNSSAIIIKWRQGFALIFLGNHLYDIGKVNESIETLKKSAVCLESANKLKELSVVYNNIGYFTYDNGDIPSALDYHYKSLQIKEQRNDSCGISYSYNNIGLIHQNLMENDEAMRLYRKALQYSTCKAGKELSVSNIGIIHDIENNLDSATLLSGYKLKIFS